MRTAELIVSLIAATLPVLVRPRFTEEWRANLAGCRELGLTPGTVVAGALATAISIDRTDPRLSGLSHRQMAASRARWSLAFLGAAGVLVFGMGLVTGTPYAGTEEPFSATAVGYIVAAVVVALAGLSAAIGCLIAARRHRAGGFPTTAVALLVGNVLVILMIGILPFSAALIGIAAIFGVGISILYNGFDAPKTEASASRRSRLVTSMALALAMIVIGALGVVNILLWNPTAQVPGMAASEIRAAMVEAGEWNGSIFVYGWAALSLVGAALLMILGTASRSAWVRTLPRLIALGTYLIALQVIGFWCAGFGIGMGLGDTFASLGPTHFTTALIHGVGQAALVVALVVSLGVTPRHRVRPAAAGAAGS